MASQGDIERVHIKAAADLWTWLDGQHSREDSVWLVTFKALHRDTYVSRDAVLDALIAYGWIDGRRMKLDEDRTMQLISPRQQQIWAETYKLRAAKLMSEGRMKQPGLDAIARSKAAGKWDALSDVDALVQPAELVDALLSGNAKSWWDKAAPSYRRNVLRWIVTAKKEQTKTKRIGIVVSHAARGEKVPNY